MHGAQIVGGQGPCVLDGSSYSKVEPVHQHHDDVAAQDGGFAGPGRPHLELLLLHRVLVVQTQEEHHPKGQDDHDRPGTLRELGHHDDHVDDEGQHGRSAIDRCPPAPLGFFLRQVVLEHPRAGHREPGEHTDRIERDQAVHPGSGDEQQDHRDDGQQQDAGREDQTVTTLGQLARQVRVFGSEACEEREPGEARIRRQHQDEHGAGLQHDVEHVAHAGSAVDVLGDLRDDGGRSSDERHWVHDGRQGAHAQDERAEDDRHDNHGDAGVASLGLSKDADAVGDRLGPGQGRSTRGERAQEHEEPGAVEKSRAWVPDRYCAGEVDGVGMQLTGHCLDCAHDDQDGHVAHEQVRGNGKDLARLSHTAEIDVGDQDHEHDGDRGRARRERGKHRCGCGDSGGHRDGNGQGVVDQQRDRRDLSNLRTEVLTGDDIGTPRFCVDLDHFEVREGDEGQHHDDGNRDRHDEGERGDADHFDQRDQRLLGGVGRGRDDVGGQDGERRRLVETLRAQLLGRERRPEQLVLQAIAEGLGERRGLVRTQQHRTMERARTSGALIRARGALADDLGRQGRRQGVAGRAEPRIHGLNVQPTGGPDVAATVARHRRFAIGGRPCCTVWVHVIVVGCGRVGSGLAMSLADEGHTVAIIDRRRQAFRRLPGAWPGEQIVGSGFDRDDLERAGAKGADALAAVTSGDNTNILTVRIARESYHIPHVVARIYDPRRAEIYQRLGIPTVATVTWTIDQVHRRLLPDVMAGDWSDASGKLALVARSLPDRWAGRRLADLEVPGQITLVAVTRSGDPRLDGRDLVGQEGDVLQLAVVGDGARTLSERLGPSDSQGRVTPSESSRS